MQVWTCVLGSSKEFGFIHVKVRLQLNEDDIRKFFLCTARLILGDLSVIADLAIVSLL